MTAEHDHVLQIIMMPCHATRDLELSSLQYMCRFVEMWEVQALAEYVVTVDGSLRKLFVGRRNLCDAGQQLRPAKRRKQWRNEVGEVRRQYWQVAGALRKAPGQHKFLQGRIGWEKKKCVCIINPEEGARVKTYLFTAEECAHVVA